MSVPTDKKLYEKVKAEIYKKYPKHSAYRSGLLVKEYKSQGGGYSGKENQSTGLNRWFRESWKNLEMKLVINTSQMYIVLQKGSLRILQPPSMSCQKKN